VEAWQYTNIPAPFWRRSLDGARRNVFLLACCQALLLTNAVTLIAIGALAGYELAPAKWLATLPSFTYIVGAALWLAARRRAAMPS